MVNKIGISVIIAMVATPVMADIASTNYVGVVKTELETEIESKLPKTMTNKNSALITDSTTGAITAGTVTTGMFGTSAVTNAKVAGGVGLNKLSVPAKCSTGSCMLIYSSTSNSYKWENISRGSDTAPTGGVDGNGVEIGGGLQCPAGQYDFGFAQCVDPSVYADNYTEDSSTMTWSAIFDYGTITGTALCSSTNGTFAVAGNPDESGAGETRYCWCKMTGPVVSSYVFYDSLGSSFCSSYCADSCGYFVQSNSSIRSALFGSVEQ